MALLFNHTSTAHVRPGIQILVRNRPFLQLASFEDTFTEEMELEMRIQNSTAKQSFCIILMVFGRFSEIIWQIFRKMSVIAPF